MEVVRQVSAMAVIAAAFLAAGVARADEEKPAEEKPAPAAAPIPDNRIYLNSKDSLRLNPIGLQSENRLVYQRRLMDSDSALFNNTFVNLGLYNRLSPAFVTAGPMVTVQPINLLTVEAGMEFNTYFGNFDQILSFSDPGDPFGDAYQEAAGSDEDGHEPENYKTNGSHLFIRPSFQIKGGPVVLKTAWSIERWNLNLTAGDSYFYDFTADTMVPNLKWTVLSDTDVLYFTPKRLIIGARYSRVAPHYGVKDTRNNQQRAGLIAILPVGKQPKFSAFHSQALIAIVSFYAQHRYRDLSPDTTWSEDDATAPVYFALVYTFTSDFLKSN